MNGLNRPVPLRLAQTNECAFGILGLAQQPFFRTIRSRRCDRQHGDYLKLQCKYGLNTTPSSHSLAAKNAKVTQIGEVLKVLPS